MGRIIPWLRTSGVLGVYLDTTTHAWVSAPLCHARWRNLEASAPQLTSAGRAVTVTAISSGEVKLKRT